MVYKRGKKGTYWLRFRFAGRIIHESTHSTSKTLAKDAEQRRKRDLELRINGLTEKRGLPPTLESAAKAWKQRRDGLVAANTEWVARRALKWLLPAFGPRLLCDIDAKSVAEYQQRRLGQGAQGRTINMEIGVLCQILRAHDCFQGLAGRIRMLPERKDLGRALSPDEERTLLEVAAKLDSACYTAVLLALSTAMRRDEIRTLQWQQIDFEKRTLTVGHAKTAAGTGRLIPLNTSAFDALVRWAGRFPSARPEHYVFPGCESRHIDPMTATKGWRTAWRRALRIAGIKCRFHDLRVTAITKLAEGQASDMTIMAIAGHVSRRMLEHYSHIRTEAKRQALERLEIPAVAVPVFQRAVHQNVNQVETGAVGAPAKLLN